MFEPLVLLILACTTVLGIDLRQRKPAGNCHHRPVLRGENYVLFSDGQFLSWSCIGARWGLLLPYSKTDWPEVDAIGAIPSCIFTSANH